MWDDFFDNRILDFDEVLIWFLDSFYNLLNVFYEHEYSWLFYLALFPAFLMLCFDIIMSFILSVRLRELRFFNVLSPKSWRVVNESRAYSQRYKAVFDSKNHPRESSLKYTRLSSFAMKLKQYKHAKAGDIIRCKDGQKFVYQGAKLGKDGSVLYVYRNNSGVYYSNMKPSQWSKSLGSQRNGSVVKSYKKK